MFKQDGLAGRGQYPQSWEGASGRRGAELLCAAMVGIDLRGYDPSGDYDPDSPRRPLHITKETVELVEWLPAAVPGGSPPAGNNRDYIMLCKWRTPILYYRATPGSTTMSLIEDIYDPLHNARFIRNRTITDGHIETLADDTNNYEAFYDYIADPQVAGGTPLPYNMDTFILVSAGKDTIYGTDEDVTNFGR